MAAVEAPPEVAEVAEQSEPVVEAEEPASPEAAPEGEAGDAQEAPSDEGTKVSLTEALKDLTPEELKAVVEQASPEVREAALGEDLRRAEQRGRTQAEEEIQGRQAIKGAYDDLIEQSYAHERTLTDAMSWGSQAWQAAQRALEFGNEDEAKQHLQAIGQVLSPQAIAETTQAIRMGARMEAARQQDAELRAYIRQHDGLFGKDGDFDGSLTEKETEALNKVFYNDQRTGTTNASKALFDLMIGRAQKYGEVHGRKKALSDKKANESLVDRLEGIQKARQAAPGTVLGTPGSTRTDAELLADPNTPVSKLVEIRSRQRG